MKSLDEVFRPEQSDFELGEHYMKTGATNFSVNPSQYENPYAAMAAAYAMGQTT